MYYCGTIVVNKNSMLLIKNSNILSYSRYTYFLWRFFLVNWFAIQAFSRYLIFYSMFSENPLNTYARHPETLDSGFDLIRSHQECIPWSPPLDIEPATTDGRAETLQLSQSPYRTQWRKLTSHRIWEANWHDRVIQVTSVLLQRIRSPPGPRLPKRFRNTHPRNYDLKGKDIDHRPSW